MFDINKVQLPYNVPLKSDMAALIVHINYKLYDRGHALYWFATKNGSNWIHVTTSAGIFKIDAPHKSIYSPHCIEQLVRWVWCPKVGKTRRCIQYRSLLSAWRSYSGDESDIKPVLLERV